MFIRPMICGILTLMAGCTAAQSSRGWVTGAEMGKPYPDFVYMDEDGTLRSLRNIAGDFTVLAFTRCDNPTHGPSTATLRQLVLENEAMPFVRIVGVDVHWFAGRCDHGRCHLVGDERNLFSICDATGAVRRLYGIGGDQAVVVIGPEGRVVQVAAEVGNEKFRSELRRMISLESERRAEELAERYQEISLGG